MSAPYEKVAVGKNQQYVVEAIRAEGTSGWRTCDHDETVLCMDGDVTVRARQADTPLLRRARTARSPSTANRTGRRWGPSASAAGTWRCCRAASAYRFEAARPSVLLQQTCLGDDTVERWADICLS